MYTRGNCMRAYVVLYRNVCNRLSSAIHQFFVSFSSVIYSYCWDYNGQNKKNGNVKSLRRSSSIRTFGARDEKNRSSRTRVFIFVSFYCVCGFYFSIQRVIFFPCSVYIRNLCIFGMMMMAFFFFLCVFCATKMYIISIVAFVVQHHISLCCACRLLLYIISSFLLFVVVVFLSFTESVKIFKLIFVVFCLLIQCSFGAYVVELLFSVAVNLRKTTANDSRNRRNPARGKNIQNISVVHIHRHDASKCRYGYKAMNRSRIWIIYVNFVFQYPHTSGY